MCHGAHICVDTRALGQCIRLLRRCEYPYSPSWKPLPQDHVHHRMSQLGDWLEGYANALDLNVWTSSALENATWDPSTRKWTMRVRRGHESREMRVPHLVFATGLGGGVPIVPSIANEVSRSEMNVCGTIMDSGAGRIRGSHPTLCSVYGC